MLSPWLGGHSVLAPFELAPGPEAAQALGPGSAEYQAAWPFTPLTIGDLEDFIDRWATWFAEASEGQLHHPSSMPERPASNWRR
jgi:hypothetical protein